MLYNLQAPGEELGDYAPHVYAEEGDTETNYELDAISIPGVSFDPDLDLSSVLWPQYACLVKALQYKPPV